MKEYTYPNTQHPTNPNLIELDFNLINSVKADDVVSFKGLGRKGFGQKYRVVSVDRTEEFSITVWCLPIKDTRKTSDARFVTNEHAWTTPNLRGMKQGYEFLPNNANGMASHVEMQIHGAR